LSNQERFMAEVAAAQLELTNASHALQELLDQTGLAQAEASLELAQAKDALREAEYKWNVQQEGNRASKALIDEAKAKLRLSESRMDHAKDNYDQYSGRDSEDLERALALQQYSAARQSYDSAVRSYNWYTGKPTELQQALLDAELAMAQARVNEAERQWEKVKDGPNPDELKLAEERVELAEASLQAAEAALAESELVAPFAGTVASIDLKPGEQAAPGQVGVVIADFDSWVIETENLTEIELPKVSQGQTVEITFDSIPDLTLEGSVESISPYYEILRGDVTYQVQVTLDEIDPRLQWGMTAVVTFQK
jgi:HlyD family secretion protein